MKKRIDTLLCSAGGVRGISFIGVIKKLEEIILQRSEMHGLDNDCHLPVIDIKRVCGVSVGSMIGLFYTLGYNSFEMSKEIHNVKLDKLKDIKFMNFIGKYGLDSGNSLMNWVESLLVRKGFDKNITFDELYNKTNIDLQVLASNVNKYTLTNFNHDTTPKIKVTEAVRMSISIPFVFTTNKFEGDIYVDGALIDSYPIHLFKDSLDTVLGMKLISNGELPDDKVDEKIENIESFVYHVMACFIVQRDRKTTVSEKYKDHTIYINTEGITQTINFSLEPSQKQTLIDVGYKACESFFI